MSTIPYRLDEPRKRAWSGLRNPVARALLGETLEELPLFGPARLAGVA